MGMDAGDVRERLGAVIAVKNKRIEELEDAVRAIRDVLIKTGPDSAVARMILATCESALLQLPHVNE
jgi:hypothetical protein